MFRGSIEYLGSVGRKSNDQGDNLYSYDFDLLLKIIVRIDNNQIVPLI